MAAAMNEYEHLVGLDEEPDYSTEPPDLPADEVEAFGLANWHLREIDQVRRQREDLEAQFKAETNRLAMRLEARRGVLDRAEAWHTRPLTNLHRAILERDPKRKTITLACGVLKARAQQPVWEVAENTLELEVWLNEHGPEVLGPVPCHLYFERSDYDAVAETISAMAAGGLLTQYGYESQAIDKNALKALLTVKPDKDEAKAGKKPKYGATADGVKAPGLTITERDTKYDIDTDVGDVAPPEEEQ